MPPPIPLPDPQWTEGPQECIGCGYSLEGLAVPGKCPECGAPFDSQVMVLHGVARSSTGTPLWRRLVWIGLFIALFVVMQGWPLFIMFGWIYLLIAFLAVISGIGAMIATGKKERSGTERFMFTSTGLARLPSKRNDRGTTLNAVFVPYTPAARLKLDTVSPFWRRMRIYAPNAKGKHTLIFDAGFRCPSEHVDRVVTTIQMAMQGTMPPAPPPLPEAPPLMHPPLSPPLLPPPQR